IEFMCPAASATVVRCNGTLVTVRSTSAALRELADHAGDPVVAGGDVAGVRVKSDAAIGLHAGDIVLGIDGRRVTAAAQLAAPDHARVSVAFRRGTADLVVDLEAISE